MDRLARIGAAFIGAYLSKANWIAAMDLYSAVGVIGYLFYGWISWLAIRAQTITPSPIAGS